MGMFSSFTLLTFICLAIIPHGIDSWDNPCTSSIRGLCVCEFPDGRKLDLTSLATHALFTAVSEYNYIYRFCQAMTGTSYPNCDGKAVACEWKDGYNGNLGKPSTQRFEMRTDSLHSTPTIALVADSEHIDDDYRRSVAYLNCDPSSQNIVYKSYGYTPPKEDNYLLYPMDFTGAAFCPTGGPPGGDSGSISAGSVMLIIFFSLVAVYFGGGFLFLTFYQKREGIERIPNHEFWLSLPGFAKEGFFYAWNSFKRCIGRQ